MFAIELEVELFATKRQKHTIQNAMRNTMKKFEHVSRYNTYGLKGII